MILLGGEAKRGLAEERLGSPSIVLHQRSTDLHAVRIPSKPLERCELTIILLPMISAL